MFARALLTVVVPIALAGAAAAQNAGSPELASPSGDGPSWRPASEAAAGALPAIRPEGTGASAALPGASLPGTALPAGSGPAPGATAAEPRRPLAKVTNGSGTLPNEKGQIWREYDIGPYTARVTSTARPEQAIVDWILRETGYEAWHGEPLGILSATRRTLRVYHTPDMQNVVADVVDRFVSSEAETTAFGLRVVTLDHPNWRARAQRLMRAVPAQTPGVTAWLIEKEDAAVVLADLQRRTDYREHSSPHLLVNNGQATAVSVAQNTPYVRDVNPRSDLPAGYEPVMGKAEEGFALDFAPLLSLDRKLIDATIRCEVNQLEKLVAVVMEVPTPAAPRQRVKLEVPQMSQLRFHERFRWPVEKVLLVSLGVVPTPTPAGGKLGGGIPLPFTNTPGRADLLVFIDCKGQIRAPAAAARPPEREAKTYRQRY